MQPAEERFVQASPVSLPPRDTLALQSVGAASNADHYDSTMRPWGVLSKDDIADRKVDPSGWNEFRAENGDPILRGTLGAAVIVLKSNAVELTVSVQLHSEHGVCLYRRWRPQWSQAGSESRLLLSRVSLAFSARTCSSETLGLVEGLTAPQMTSL